jgi:hypothetical protein
MDNKTGHTNSIKFLTLSQRIARILVSIILVVIVTTEASPPTTWLLALSAIAVYAIVTGLLGWDPILKLLKQSHPHLPDQKLSFAAQLECAGFGAICVAIGVLFRDSDSVLLRVLPFLGIYPILLCAIKYDLLAYLLHSYRRGFATRDTD